VQLLRANLAIGGDWGVLILGWENEVVEVAKEGGGDVRL
jgi:hypothetical protein